MSKESILKKKAKNERLARVAEGMKKNIPGKPRVSDKKKNGIVTPKRSKSKPTVKHMFADHMETKKARLKKILSTGPKIALQEEKSLKGVK